MSNTDQTRSQALGKAIVVATAMLLFGVFFFLGIVILAVKFASKTGGQ